MSGSVVVGTAVLGGLVIGVELLMWWLISRHGHGHDHDGHDEGSAGHEPGHAKWPP